MIKIAQTPGSSSTMPPPIISAVRHPLRAGGGEGGEGGVERCDIDVPNVAHLRGLTASQIITTPQTPTASSPAVMPSALWSLVISRQS
jgi:hypothetical protein